MALAAACSDGTGPGHSPAQIVVVSGDEQDGVVGAELTLPVAVRVLDLRARPVTGEVVEFEVVSGGGAVAVALGESDADGRVEARWTLGTSTAETQRLAARLPDRAPGHRVVAFVTASPRADVPASLVSSGSGQRAAAGTQLPDSIRVEVRDRFGNPVPAQRVSWSVAAGGGGVSPATTTTDDTGMTATAWSLGPGLGQNEVSATLGALSATFLATATPGAVASIELQPDSAAIGIAGDTVFRALARDAFGNEIPDPALEWSTSDAAVASLESSGVVRGVAVGVVEVAARSGAVAGSARLSVDERVNGWSARQRPLSLFSGVGGAGEAVYVVGAGGLVARATAGGWEQAPALTDADLFAVWGTTSDHLFAVGAGGVVIRRDGDSWSTMISRTTGTLRALHGSSPTSAVAVGDAGVVLHFDGFRWSPEASGTTADLRDVWVAGTDESYAVGAGGKILRRSGVTWNAMASGSSADLIDVSGGPQGIVAVAGDGSVLQLGAGGWTMTSGPAPAGFGSFVDAWAGSPTSIYAINNEAGDLGAIYYFDGTAWARIHVEGEPTPFSAWQLASISGESRDEIRVAGYRDLGPVGTLLEGQR